MKLCGVMRAELEKIEVHDLWLVACFLYPYLRDMNFWDDPIQRTDFRKRAEAMTRLLLDQIEESDEYCGVEIGVDSTSKQSTDQGVQWNADSNNVPLQSG